MTCDSWAQVLWCLAWRCKARRLVARTHTGRSRQDVKRFEFLWTTQGHGVLCRNIARLLNLRRSF